MKVKIALEVIACDVSPVAMFTTGASYWTTGTLCTARKHNAPPGNPGTEVVGELPRLVPLGDLGEEEEAAEKIKQGLKLMREFMGEEDVTVIINSNSYLSDNIAKLVREETEEAWGWKIRKFNEMVGAEADRVVYIGCVSLEPLSRARISLGILLCCQTERSRTYYNISKPAIQKAIEEGLVLVATLPSHPQVACNCFFKVEFDIFSDLNLDRHPLHWTSSASCCCCC